MNKIIPGAIIIEGHVQGLSNTRSLGEAGIPVYVVDKTNCIARYSRFCNKFFKCPDFLEDSFAYFLIELAEKEGLKDWVLIPSNDHAVFTIAKHKISLEKHFKVITPSLEIISNIYDKSRLLKIAEENGIPVPLTYCIGYNENINIPESDYPVLIKGRFGLSFFKTFKRKVFLAHNEKELRDKLRLIKAKKNDENILVQKLIRSDRLNRTISFAAFCENGIINAYWMGIKLREHPIEFGTATFARSIFVKECFEQSSLLLKAINYTGVCEIEYLFDYEDLKYKLIEINARTWLWVGLAKASGVDFAKMIYNYVNGSQNIYPPKYNTELNWRNSFTDIIYTSLALIKGKISLSSILEQNKGTIVDAVSYSGDNKPFWAYLFLMSTFLFRR